MSNAQTQPQTSMGLFDRFPDVIEKVGVKLPDPAVLFLLALLARWVASIVLAGAEVKAPKAGGEFDVMKVESQLAGKALVTMLTRVRTKRPSG